VVSARWPRRDSAKNKQKTPVGVATGASRYASQGTRDAFLRYLLSILSAILRGQVLVRARLAVDVLFSCNSLLVDGNRDRAVPKQARADVVVVGIDPQNVGRFFGHELGTLFALRACAQSGAQLRIRGARHGAFFTLILHSLK
jgi:hypothetical protein